MRGVQGEEQTMSRYIDADLLIMRAYMKYPNAHNYRVALQLRGSMVTSAEQSSAVDIGQGNRRLMIRPALSRKERV